MQAKQSLCLGPLQPPRHCSWQHVPSSVQLRLPHSGGQTKKINFNYYIQKKRFNNITLLLWQCSVFQHKGSLVWLETEQPTSFVHGHTGQAFTGRLS